VLEFAARVTVLCFAASYGIGVVNEICRVLWPRLAAWPSLAAAAAGLFAQSLFLVSRGFSEHRLPTATPFESLMVLSWLTAAAYLFFAIKYRRLTLGLFLLPVSLGLSLFATTALDRESAAALSGKFLGVAHGLLLLVAVLLVALAIVFSAMYLVKSRQLRSAAFLDRLRLPSLERLDHWNYLSMTLGWAFLTLGVAIGFGLQKLAWSDPKVVVTIMAWVALTYLANYRRIHPEHRGKRQAWGIIVAGAILIVAVVGDPVLGTAHQALRGEAP
jgi:ABC-type uncharacterized transport system permease subunit